jgi:hypothetical protein
VCRSFRQLSKHINSWFPPSTVEIWHKNHTSFHIYAKNIKPGLSVENRAKQVAFSKHVHNKWGLGPEVKKVRSGTRNHETNALICPPQEAHRQGYGTLHICLLFWRWDWSEALFLYPTLTLHTPLRWTFFSLNLHTGNPEDGGTGYLIGTHRCATFKVPQKDVHFTTKDSVTGKTVYRGNPIKRLKGIPLFLVDCNVKGIDAGTTNMPCFPLRLYGSTHWFLPLKSL